MLRKKSAHLWNVTWRVFLQLRLCEMNRTVHIVLHPLNIKLEDTMRNKSAVY